MSYVSDRQKHLCFSVKYLAICIPVDCRTLGCRYVTREKKHDKNSMRCADQMIFPFSTNSQTVLREDHGRIWSPFHPFRGRGWRRSQNGVSHKMRREEKKGERRKPVDKRHQMVSGSLALPYCFFIVSFLVISMEAGQRPR